MDEERTALVEPKIGTGPGVYLIGRPEICSEALDQLLETEGIRWRPSGEASEALAEIGGRLCYMSFDAPRPGGTRAYIERIISAGHVSVLEHNCFTWVLTGLSRDTTHELVRYRHMSFSQLSGRYVDARDLSFVMPDLISLRPELAEIWREGLAAAFEAYQQIDNALAEEFTREELRSRHGDQWHEHSARDLSAEDRRTIRKRSREAARGILPGACGTKIQVSANVRELRHFFEERCNRAAAAEIRRIACLMFAQATLAAPLMFQGYEKEALPDGTFHLSPLANNFKV